MAIGQKTRFEYSDYAEFPSDGNRYEILEGDLLMTPAPSPQHQRISKRLQRQLEAYFEDRHLGEVFNAPIDVILTHRDVVQPDLVVVTDPEQISRRGIEGAPHLVVEVLSPGSQHQDQVLKARRYAALGVPHYGIVDPEGRSLECFRAQGGAYLRVAECAAQGVLQHPDWKELQIDLDALWK